MTVGTLRDQVIYPHLAEDFRRRGSVDSDLEDILNKVCTIPILLYEPSVMHVDWGQLSEHQLNSPCDYVPLFSEYL